MDAVIESTDAAALSPGTILSDRYLIVSLLGEGGMGAVYRAEHVHMKKAFALKVLLSDLAKQPEIVARFEREAIAAGNIEHPNVVAATDFGRLPDGSFFLVMEYVEGRSLRDELANGPIPPGRALSIAHGILAAVEAAHAKGIVHRDLKPENVMLVARDDDPDFAKVLDFGIAKLDVSVPTSGTNDAPAPGGALLTRMGMIMGTPEYMAPEQALGQTVDARADLYAVGVILYEMLAGKPPFHGDPLMVMRAQVMNDAPPLPEAVTVALPGLSAFMGRALAKEPAGRFQDAKELRAGMSDALTPAPPASAQALGRPSSPTIGGAVSVRDSQPLDPVGPTSAYAAFVPPQTNDKSVFGLKPAHLIGGAVALVVGFIVVSLLIFRGGRGESTAAHANAEAAPSASASVVATALPPLPPPPSPAAASAKVVELDDQPPLATAKPHTKGAARPRPAAKKPASKKKPAAKPRRTGPGGIYVPPPSTWFK